MFGLLICLFVGICLAFKLATTIKRLLFEWLMLGNVWVFDCYVSFGRKLSLDPMWY
nr:MAG TPA: hypothetical protein [Caudoviricetes sp.]